MSGKYASFPPVGIVSYSDFYRLPEKKVWGDYWLKENLMKEFKKIGYPVNNERPEITLHLFGEPLQEHCTTAYNILWIHSHPDWITPDILRNYQKIFCISPHFINKIAAMGFLSEFLMIPTAMAPLTRKKIYDIVFVGNTKKGQPRRIISDIGNISATIRIWGWGWKGLIPDNWYGGECYENAKLNGLYAESKIVLNDHHEDMRREGFINPRILDVLASGGFVVSDDIVGIDELLEGNVATYNSSEELRTLLAKYLYDAPGRDALSAKGRELALQYSFPSACLRIIRHIESISDKLLV